LTPRRRVVTPALDASQEEGKGGEKGTFCVSPGVAAKSSQEVERPPFSPKKMARLLDFATPQRIFENLRADSLGRQIWYGNRPVARQLLPKNRTSLCPPSSFRRLPCPRPPHPVLQSQHRTKERKNEPPMLLAAAYQNLTSVSNGAIIPQWPLLSPRPRPWNNSTGCRRKLSPGWPSYTSGWKGGRT